MRKVSVVEAMQAGILPVSVVGTGRALKRQARWLPSSLQTATLDAWPWYRSPVHLDTTNKIAEKKTTWFP